MPKSQRVPKTNCNYNYRSNYLLTTRRDLYRFWELRVQVRIRLLGQGVLSDSVEGLLDVDGLLGGCLKVGDVVLALAPLLGPLL